MMKKQTYIKFHPRGICTANHPCVNSVANRAHPLIRRDGPRGLDLLLHCRQLGAGILL